MAIGDDEEVLGVEADQRGGGGAACLQVLDLRDDGGGVTRERRPATTAVLRRERILIIKTPLCRLMCYTLECGHLIHRETGQHGKVANDVISDKSRSF